MVLGLAFHPQGHCLASASWDKTIKLWQTSTGAELGTVRGHTGVVTAVAFRPDGSRLASASEDTQVKVWDTATSLESRLFGGHGTAVLSLAFSPDGQQLLTGSGRVLGKSPGEAKLWDVASGRTLNAWEWPSGTRCVAWSPNGQHWACAHDQTVTVHEASTGQQAFALEGHCGTVVAIAFSQDGRYLASAGTDGVVFIWLVRSGKESQIVRPQRSPRALAFHPDSRRLALASEDLQGGRGEVCLWDVATATEVLKLPQLDTSIAHLLFSRDEATLVGASRSGNMQVWDVLTGEEVNTLCGHTAEIAALAFSPDELRLASASHDRTIKIWESATGQELLTLRNPSSEFSAVTFSPDGRRLAAACLDGTVRLWDAPTLLAQRPAVHLSGTVSSKNWQRRNN